MTEEDLRNLLESGVLESHVFSAVYGLATVNTHIIQERVKVKHMKSLTQSEFELLKEAEDILFNHVDYGANSVFDKAFCELHKSLKKYTELMLKDMKAKDKKVIENYVKSDIASLNNLYNEKGDE